MRRPRSIHKLFVSYVIGVILITLTGVSVAWVWTDVRKHHQIRANTYNEFLRRQDEKLEDDMQQLMAFISNNRMMRIQAIQTVLKSKVTTAEILMTANAELAGRQPDNHEINNLLDLVDVDESEGNYFVIRRSGGKIHWSKKPADEDAPELLLPADDLMRKTLSDTTDSPHGEFLTFRCRKMGSTDTTDRPFLAKVKYLPQFHLYVGYCFNLKSIETDLSRDVLVALETAYRTTGNNSLVFNLDGKVFLNRIASLELPSYLWNYNDDLGLPVFTMMRDSAQMTGSGFLNYHFKDKATQTAHRLRLHLRFVREWNQVIVLAESADRLHEVVNMAVEASRERIVSQIITLAAFMLVLLLLLVLVSRWFSLRIRSELNLFTRRMSDALRHRGEMLHDEFRFSELQQLAVSFTTLLRRREKTHEDLQESERRYRMITANISDVMFTLDKNFHFSFVSPSVYRLLGYLPEQVQMMAPEEFLPITEHRRMQVSVVNMIRRRVNLPQGQRGGTIELDIKHAEGYRIPVEIFVNPVTGTDGNFIYLLGVARDIRERRKAQQSLLESEARYRMISDNVKDLIWSCDRDFKITYMSQAIQSLCGYQATELLGQSISVILTSDGYNKCLTRLEESRKTIAEKNSRKLDEVLEVEYQHRVGTKFFAEMSISAVLDNHGTILGYNGITRDISERHKANEELRQSESKLRETNAAKDKFFSILAHDLRNPFSSLIGFSSVLAERFDLFSDSEKVTIINQLRFASESSYRLIENLLEWSRTQTNSLLMDPEVFDVSEVIHESVKLHQAQALRKSIEIEIEVAPGTMIYADRNMIGTVFRNLISNAIKFSFERGRVVIRYEITMEIATFIVSDEGIGIPAQNLSRLFRIDEKIKTNGTFNEPGSGLGLILCREFIIRNGGTLWVESISGKGSTFSFCLPRH